MEQKSRVDVMVMGLGGFGALLLGRLLTEAGASTYKHVSFFPNYGFAVRGGDSECTVILSDEEIKSPVVLHPTAMLVMGSVGIEQFENRVAPEGMLFLDGSLIPSKIDRKDVALYSIPAAAKAKELGDMRTVNQFFLGAYLEATKIMELDLLIKALQERMGIGARSLHDRMGGVKETLFDLNVKAMHEGARLIREQK